MMTERRQTSTRRSLIHQEDGSYPQASFRSPHRPSRCTYDSSAPMPFGVDIAPCLLIPFLTNPEDAAAEVESDPCLFPSVQTGIW
jgi:hypothetical protein